MILPVAEVIAHRKWARLSN